MSKIIGQDKLIKEVNRIFQVFVNSNCKIRPYFILTGESGSGKSFTIKQLCDMNELSFLEVNAAQITKEGCLETVFEDGILKKEYSLEEIRQRIDRGL